jgi:AbrB family looped-hinge helix DNA binding protein
MKNGVVTSVDSAGRLVLPKDIRDEARIEPGMPLRVIYRDGRVEIEPEPRDVEVRRKGKLHIAVPRQDGEPLREADVRKTAVAIRRERSRR